MLLVTENHGSASRFISSGELRSALAYQSVVLEFTRHVKVVFNNNHLGGERYALLLLSEPFFILKIQALGNASRCLESDCG